MASGQTASQKETIVYEVDRDSKELQSIAWPTSDLYSMSVDGTNVKALTKEGHSHSPSWSSDG
jgi:Tol biopolymer transport system component